MARLNNEVETSAPEPATETQQPPTNPRPRGRKVRWIAIPLVFFGLLVAGGGGFLWWQQGRQLESLDAADSAVAQSVDENRAAIQSLEERMDTLQRAGAAQLEASGRLGASVEELSTRYGALEARIDDFQGVSGDARRRWLLAEAEHYLSLGNAELSLGGHWENAIVALELADGALAQLADPAFAEARREISADLLTLRSAELVDVEGLSHTLGRLAGRVDELPMGPAALDNLIAEPQGLENVESGWSRVWLSIRGAISGMIRVERSDVSESPALTAREQSLVRRQLALELESARLALLRNQPQVFSSGLETAGNLLTSHFDGSEPSVRSAVTLLEDMMQLDIAPERPDIGSSLSLLRELAARDG